MWLAATIGELATFRWRRPLLASLPCVGLFSFLMIVGHRRAASLMLVVFLAALLLYWALESTHRLRSWGRWVPAWDHVADAPDPVTGATARRMGAACLGAALLSPLVLPALQDGLLVWRSGTGVGSGEGGGAGTSVDLLVSLVPDTLEQTDQQLFTVTSERADYWRLASLGRFDGKSWLPIENRRISADIALAGINAPEDPGGAAPTIRQQFVLDSLRGDFLPAAVEPVALDMTGDSLDRDVESVFVDPETSDLRIAGGLTGVTSYIVESRVPNPSYARLRNAEIGTPEDPALAAIPELAPEASELRDRWTAGIDNPFERLVAIQDRLRRFAYSTDVPSGTSTDLLTEFLTETRTGYCQQFSTAFALLARSLGYPARVSVGFLPGEVDTASGTYTVRGTHTHAWPEVLFDGYGWVRFEPTPRAVAEPPVYTSAPLGAAGQGAGRGGGANARTGPEIARQLPQGTEGRSEFTPNDFGLEERRFQLPAWRETFNRLAVWGLALLVAFLVAVPLAKEWRTRRRYRLARSPEEIARASFAHFEDEAAELASPRQPSESAVTYARRVCRDRGALVYEGEQLARVYEAAEYSPGRVTPGQAETAANIAGRLRSRLWAEASWWERAVRLFSPRRLRAGATPARVRLLRDRQKAA
jgi:transglutaminase-like putative cysteine protease